MEYTLQITCNNAAFEDDPGRELARILRKEADRLAEDDLGNRKLRDSNGNTVGEAWFENREETDDDLFDCTPRMAAKLARCADIARTQRQKSGPGKVDITLTDAIILGTLKRGSLNARMVYLENLNA